MRRAVADEVAFASGRSGPCRGAFDILGPLDRERAAAAHARRLSHQGAHPLDPPLPERDDVPRGLAGADALLDALQAREAVLVVAVGEEHDHLVGEVAAVQRQRARDRVADGGATDRTGNWSIAARSAWASCSRRATTTGPSFEGRKVVRRQAVDELHAAVAQDDGDGLRASRSPTGRRVTARMAGVRTRGPASQARLKLGAGARPTGTPSTKKATASTSTTPLTVARSRPRSAVRNRPWTRRRRGGRRFRAGAGSPGRTRRMRPSAGRGAGDGCAWASAPAVPGSSRARSGRPGPT